MTGDDQCARCGLRTPGAKASNLDVCDSCDRIVTLELDNERLHDTLDQIADWASGPPRVITTTAVTERLNLVVPFLDRTRELARPVEEVRAL